MGTYTTTSAFQSTLPARGATVVAYCSPLSVPISIHAPRTGSDAIIHSVKGRYKKFQSTLPARGATHSRLQLPPFPSYFNPRSPHGERPRLTWWSELRKGFQSTLPARGATFHLIDSSRVKTISSPAPRTGSDFIPPIQLDAPRRISIHAPRTGSDLVILSICTPPVVISIHAPRTGSDSISGTKSANSTGFQSTLPARGATRQEARHSGAPHYFNPRSPHGERLIP